MSPKQVDLGTRVDELAATVRGLTQELVEADERIRELEEALEEGDGRRDEAPGVGAGSNGTDDGTSTKQIGGQSEAEDETSSDLDDIIVA